MDKARRLYESSRRTIKSMLSGDYNLSDKNKIKHLTEVLKNVLDIINEELFGIGEKMKERRLIATYYEDDDIEYDPYWVVSNRNRK